jgi:hypothetical protein
MGHRAGYSNTTAANNTFIGTGSGYSNTTGNVNTAIGFYSLYTCATGTYNTALGYQALTLSTNGDHNTAVGVNAGYSTTTGDNNIYMGEAAGATNTTGSNNTYIGFNADGNNVNYSNSSAFGNGAVTTATNKIRVGNSSVTVIEGQVDWSWPSDGRFKENVTEEVKGLEFINRLRPVVYNFNTKKFEEFLTKSMPDSVRRKHLEGVDFGPSTAIRQSGFIAQEVEKAAAESGYDFNSLHKPANENDNYSLSYAGFVMPLVKSVQQLSKQDTELQKENAKQDSVIAALQKQIAALTAAKANGSGTLSTGETAAAQDVNLKDGQSVVLDQNVPNPFAEQTVIGYFLPEDTQKAQMLFYNAMGKLIQSTDLQEKGKGSLNVFASDLSNGTYTYTLVVNGKVVETKKMMKQQ